MHDNLNSTMSSSSLSSFVVLALIAANVLLADVVAFVPPPTPFGMGRHLHPQNQQSQVNSPGLVPLQPLQSIGAPDDDRFILEDDDDDDEEAKEEKVGEVEEDSYAKLVFVSNEGWARVSPPDDCEKSD
jgi:hypothetical protein